MITIHTTGLDLLDVLAMSLLFATILVLVIRKFERAGRLIEQGKIILLTERVQELESELLQKNDELTVAKANSW